MAQQLLRSTTTIRSVSGVRATRGRGIIKSARSWPGISTKLNWPKLACVGFSPEPHPLAGQELTSKEWHAVSAFIKSLVARQTIAGSDQGPLT